MTGSCPLSCMNTATHVAQFTPCDHQTCVAKYRTPSLTKFTMRPRVAFIHKVNVLVTQANGVPSAVLCE